jgi:hypothetical protein
MHLTLYGIAIWIFSASALQPREYAAACFDCSERLLDRRCRSPDASESSTWNALPRVSTYRNDGFLGHDGVSTVAEQDANGNTGQARSRH